MAWCSYLHNVFLQPVDLLALTRGHQVATCRSGVGANHDAIVEDQTHNGGARGIGRRWLVAHAHKLLIAAEDDGARR